MSDMQPYVTKIEPADQEATICSRCKEHAEFRLHGGWCPECGGEIDLCAAHYSEMFKSMRGRMKSKHFTPLHIMLLLHYQCIATPWPQRNARAVIEYTGDLEMLGLIEQDGGPGSGWKTTQRGEEHIIKLRELPVIK